MYKHTKRQYDDAFKTGKGSDALDGCITANLALNTNENPSSKKTKMEVLLQLVLGGAEAADYVCHSTGFPATEPRAVCSAVPALSERCMNKSSTIGYTGQSMLQCQDRARPALYVDLITLRPTSLKKSHEQAQF
jgi:hypothetical protein